MTWYVIKWDGQTYTENISGADEKVLTGLGIHGYATEAEAQANPQTMNDAQAALGGAQALAGVSGSATNIPTPGGTAAGAGQAASTASSIDSAVTGFLGDLTQRALWLRVAKIVVGVALIIAGVVQLTHAQNIVATAAKGAVLA
jgi:hypothetical protein